jgi:hypothetical protein
MLLTMCRMHSLEKDRLKDPSLSPAIPTIPEMSPVEILPLLIKGFPGARSTEDIVLITETVASKKELIISTFIVSDPLH